MMNLVQSVPVAGVFTLQSIKSRIETMDFPSKKRKTTMFLLYSPLNQGLKPH